MWKAAGIVSSVLLSFIGLAQASQAVNLPKYACQIESDPEAGSESTEWLEIYDRGDGTYFFRHYWQIGSTITEVMEREAERANPSGMVLVDRFVAVDDPNYSAKVLLDDIGGGSQVSLGTLRPDLFATCTAEEN